MFSLRQRGVEEWSYRIVWYSILSRLHVTHTRRQQSHESADSGCLLGRIKPERILLRSQITENQLDQWVRGNSRRAQETIVNLVYRLVVAACPSPIERRFPLGDSIGQHGPDGILEVSEGYPPFVPEGRSLWEIGTGQNAGNKATDDYNDLTGNVPEETRKECTFVFVTPLSARRDWEHTWKEGAQANWLERRRAQENWKGIEVIDGTKLIDWVLQFPDVAEWLTSEMSNSGEVSGDTVDAISNRIDAGLSDLKGFISSFITHQSSVLEDSEGRDATVEEQFRVVTDKVDMARNLINNGSIVSGREILEQLRLDNENLPDGLEFRIITNLGACALGEGNIDKACSLFEEAHLLLPDDPRGLANAALAAHLRGNSEFALEFARRALETDRESSNAAAVLIREYSAGGHYDQLDDFVTANPWVLKDEEAGIAVATSWTRQEKFDEAASLLRSLIDIYPECAELRISLTECLLFEVQAGRPSISYTDDVNEKLLEGTREATEALVILKDTQLKASKHTAFIVRAGARALLGESSEAVSDLDTVLNEDPSHSQAALNLSFIFLNSDRPDRARPILERLRDSDLGEEVIRPLGEAYLLSGEPKMAADLLRNHLTLEKPNWDDVHLAQTLNQAETQSGLDDTVGPMLESRLLQNPDDPRLLTLKAVHTNPVENPEESENLLLKGLESADQSDRRVIAELLGKLYRDLERFDEAADKFDEVVNGLPTDPAAVSLLECLVNSGQLREALSWARKIQEANSVAPRAVIDLEAQILDYVGDVAAASSKYEELVSLSDSSPIDRIRLATAQVRCGRHDDARKTLSSVNGERVGDDARSILKLAHLKLLLDVPGSLEDLYLARRHGINDPDIHLGYFELFQACAGNLVEPERVTVGCAVLVKNDEVERWWHILDDTDVSLANNELLPGDDFALRLMGLRVGDTIDMGHEYEELVYEIRAVQSKFLYAYQETANDFSTRFPSKRSLWKVDVSDDYFEKIFMLVERRAQSSGEIYRTYSEGKLPLSLFSSEIGHSVIDIWRSISEDSSSRIHFAAGSEEEEIRSGTLLRGARGIVLDTVALLTVHRLGLMDYISRRFSRVAVPQQVIDEVQQAIFAFKVRPSTFGHLGKDIDGRYYLAESSESASKEWEEYVESLMELAKSLDPISAYGLLDGDSPKDLVNLLTSPEVGAIFAGDQVPEDDMVLVSDDRAIAEISHSIGVGTANTQAVLNELRRSRVIDDESYSSWVEQLILLNYSFVRVYPNDIINRFEASGYLTTKGIRALLRSIEGPECTEDSAVSVAADVISSLVLKGVPIGQVELILSAVISALRQGRTGSFVLSKFRNRVASSLSTAPFLRYQILQTIELYMRV